MSQCQRSTLRSVFPVLTVIAALFSSATNAQQNAGFEASEPMTDALRAEFGFMVVRPGSAAASEHLTGTYEKQSLTMIDGIAKGRGLGRVNTDVGGIPVGISIPGVSQVIGGVGAVVGGIVGAQQETLQKFRDRLARNLSEAGGKPMSSESLADDVFWLIREQPALKTRLLLADQAVPSGADSTLFVNVDSVQISVQDADAVIMTSATASVARLSDSTIVFEQTFVYEDKDTLQNWTKNDDAAWHSYAAYARHYLAREIAARLYERVDAWATLAPAKSKDIKLVRKNPWAGTTKLKMPELSWDIDLSDETVAAGAVSYDVEIYDAMQMVYAEKGVQGNSYRLPVALEDCTTYRWSVRPVYRSGEELRRGEWMRAENGKATKRGGSGLKASEITAYLYDFPSLEVRCGSR